MTFGNHDFDLGPDGLGKSIGVAAKAGRVPAVLASNSNFAANDATLAALQRLAKAGVIRRHVVIEQGNIRLGVFGCSARRPCSTPLARVRLRSPTPSRPPGRW